MSLVSGRSSVWLAMYPSSVRHSASRSARAVRFDEYGGFDVLEVVDVSCPVPGTGQVLVQVKAAGINPGETKIRMGLEDSTWPATFPSGQGSDLAGIVAQAGPGVTSFSAGDEVIGWTDNRASQAEYVVVEEQHLTAKPLDRVQDAYRRLGEGHVLGKIVLLP
jgi:NADPH:quinone reductase-like Zn-dependent oxidoreductase